MTQKGGQSAWWKERVFYQIYPLSFYDTNNDGKGDIQGIITKLPYLKKLGIGAVWISPMYQSPMVDNGYDISDYDAIDPTFGTMEDFEQLLDCAHALDIKVMMDLVINHTSDKHPWFIKSRRGKNNDKSDFYIWHDAVDGKEPNNWAADFGGSAWAWDKRRKQYYLHLFSKHQPDLNWHNPAVKKELFAMMRRWLARGVDGFRMDMGNFLFKAEGFPDAERGDGDTRPFIHGEHLYANQPGIHELLKEMHRDVLAPHNAVVLGEMYFLTPEEGLKYVGYDRKEIHMLYQYHIMDARGDWSRVNESVRTWADAFAGKAWNTITFSNHDSPRSVSIYGDSLYHHDASAKCIMTYLLTAPGTPFFLQGEEIGMTNTTITSPDQLTDVKMRGIYEERLARGENPKEILSDLSWWNRDNARTPMQWNAGLHGGFSNTNPWLDLNPNYKHLNVEDEMRDPHSIWSYVRDLITMRNVTPTLVYGDYTPLYPDNWMMYGFVRSDDTMTLAIFFNFASNENYIDMPDILRGDRGHRILGNYRSEDKSTTDRLVLAPWETRIYRIKSPIEK